MLKGIFSIAQWIAEAHQERKKRYISITDLLHYSDEYQDSDLAHDLDKEAIIRLSQVRQVILDLRSHPAYSLSEYDFKAHIEPTFDRLISKIRRGEIFCRAFPQEKIIEGGHINVTDLLSFIEEQNLSNGEKNPNSIKSYKVKEKRVVELTQREKNSPFAKDWPLVTPSSPYKVQQIPTNELLDIKRIFLLAISFCASFHCHKNSVQASSIPFVHETAEARALIRQSQANKEYIYRGVRYKK